MERRKRDFEAKADQHHQRTDAQQRRVLRAAREAGLNRLETERASRTEDQRDAEDQNRAGEAAEQEILHARFFGLIALLEARQHVHAETHDLKTDQQCDEIPRVNKQHRARDRVDQNRVELALRHVFALSSVHARDDRQQTREDQNDTEA